MQNSQKFDGLQIARAIAALSVAYYHSKSALILFPKDTAHPIPFLSTYGGFGVAFFFAISGFVVCLVTAKPGFGRISFLIKRAFRIYPLWIVCCAACWYFTRNFSIPPDTLEHIIRSFLLLPTDGYPVLDVGWSLQHEVAFYLVAAIVIPIAGSPGLAVFLILGWVAHYYADMPWWVKMFTVNYGYFLTGIFAYWAKDRLRFAGWIAPIALGSFIFWYSTEGGIPLPRHLAFPISFFFVMIGFINMRVTSPTGRLGALLGDASYSIYLFHPLVFFSFYANFPSTLPPVWSEEIIRFAALAATCILAVASWKLFETPVNRIGHALGETTSRSENIRRLPDLVVGPIGAVAHHRDGD